MAEKITIGPVSKGLRNDVTAFNVDDDAFPVLRNAYQWRGRVKRKRGTAFLNRLKRFFNSNLISYSPIASFNLVAGAGNLISGFNLEPNSNIVPGVTIIDNTTSTTYTDPTIPDGTLIGAPSGSGTINYATGAITIAGATTDSISARFNYFPDLPALGIEDLVLISTQFPGTLAFDTKYSYNVVTADPYPIYDVSFYKNPPTAAFPLYTQKTNATPTTWNGQDYQQYWGVNYQGAFWVTNGINIPFSPTNIGMQFKGITDVVVVPPGTGPAIITITIPAHGLVLGDFLYFNEIIGMTGINFQTGYVTNVVDANTVSVTLPNATIAGTYSSGGIAQYLTNRSDVTKDCIRFYDGDPTNGNVTNPTLMPGKGWVNFAPPLSQAIFSIADLPAAQYYLVGCRMIQPFKDRLLFLGAVIQSSGGGPIYLQDTIIYSQNGTPYYTASYTNAPNAAMDFPTSPLIIFTPILVPINQTATAPAYFEDSTGFGGFITAGLFQPITTCSSNEDVLIVGLSTIKTRVVFSGNDIVPFNFFIINAELGDASTFSTINMDKGVISRGTRGFTITSQVESQRIDLYIPDEVFQINLTVNGNERFSATRDFINEWIYFTYPSNTSKFRFPNQTLLYNYRDNSWALFRESYTCYGAFRQQTGFTWQTVGLKYKTWGEWNDPWGAGESNLLQQEVLSGNQQGFLLLKDEGSGEGISLYIQSIVGNVITSPDHNLEDGDFIIISNAIGTVGPIINGKIFSVATITANTFTLNPDPDIGTATYLGLGTITRMYIPFIQTKQFPPSWSMGRKTRIGVQQYLFTATAVSQITLLIFLSQNADFAYNNSPIVPDVKSINNSLIYSTVLYTCPESTNLGLTAANTNLQTIINPSNGTSPQAQIWHRLNTSLIGDTVQIGFTLSEAQMRATFPNGQPINAFAEIEFHAAILDVSPSQLLC